MSKEQTSYHTIEREIAVEFKYTPPCPGARDSLGGVAGAGPALEPDEPAEVEILKVTYEGSDVEIQLTEEETERITHEILESIADGDFDVYDSEID